ncbi:hypothetical protein K488DRAFT_73545 [Vararia minispora EC-137]|uniref:Uncharacterized protein n=1 Tax=Vararia minispora EC-137 TaxID=1314806 RepID=A0ACB8QBR5_9AGAM|nr:hypothetical protein K488DRAFT_73545 [Vararia minispora EC-137]
MVQHAKKIQGNAAFPWCDGKHGREAAEAWSKPRTRDVCLGSSLRRSRGGLAARVAGSRLAWEAPVACAAATGPPGAGQSPQPAAPPTMVWADSSGQLLMRRSRVVQRRTADARRESAADEGTEVILDIRRATIDIGGPNTDRRSMFSMRIKNPDPVCREGVEGPTLDHSPGARIETIAGGEGGSGREEERGDSTEVRRHGQTSGDDVRSHFRGRPLPRPPSRPRGVRPLPARPLPRPPVAHPASGAEFVGVAVQDEQADGPGGQELYVVSPPHQEGPLQHGARSSLGARSMYRAAMRHSVDPSALYLVFEAGDLARATGEGTALF